MKPIARLPALGPDSSGVPPGARRLAAIYGLVMLARMLLMTVLPLKALDVFGAPQFVSGVYFLIGCVAIATSLSIPALAYRMDRRLVFLVGAGLLAICLPFLASADGVAFGVGLALQAMGVVILEVVMALYALDTLRRTEFLSYEPIRLFVGGSAAVLGPWLGVWLATNYGQGVAFLASGVGVAGLVLYYLSVRRRLGEATTRRKPANPLGHIREFFGQPRMLLAYLLAMGRSGWWMTFYVYLPIVALSLGFSRLEAASLVSLTMIFLLTAPFWGWVARRLGTRAIVRWGYLVCGTATVGAGLMQHQPVVAMGLFVFASLGLATLDGPGNTFFLRAVRPLRRPEMTAVFSTYRDVGQTLPQLVFALLLLVFDLSAVLYAAGIGAILLGLLAGKLPRRL